MSNGELVTQETFDSLLEWLGGERSEAGEKYEKIRGRLIGLFINRGCVDAEELADETINRVSLKLPGIAETYKGEPIIYFHAVANKVHKEWLRQQKFREKKAFIFINRRHSIEYECLETCLETLSADQRKLIIEYYQGEKITKIRLRKAIADRHNINLHTLQVRTNRIRARLLKCIKNCAEKKI